MKKITIMVILCGLTIFTKAQVASVEKTTSGIQAGLLSVWINNESKLTNEISLRSEIGFDSGIFGGSFYNKTGFLMTPVITFEPRWYYNLEKRATKSKNIAKNSGNFLAIRMSYNPNWFVLSNYENLEVIDQVSFIPKWGIRRVVGEHFSFETGIGVGYRYVFAKSAGYLENESEIAIDLHLRIGFNL